MQTQCFSLFIGVFPRLIFGFVGCALVLAPQTVRATQDEIALPMDTREALFSEQDDDDVRPLSGAIGLIDVGAYPLGKGHHHWHGKVMGDVALLTSGDELVWHASLAAETVADDENEIDFRLVRLFYEFRIAVDYRLGPGVFWVALNHRCGHGTDGALPGRILIRSSIESGYRVALRWDLFEAAFMAYGHGIILGQNTDLQSQIRGLFAGAAQFTVNLPVDFSVVGAAGLGVALVGAGPEDIYLISDQAPGLGGELLPTAVLGVAYQGIGASLGVMLHYQRIVDTGLTDSTQPMSLLSIRLRFVW